MGNEEHTYQQQEDLPADRSSGRGVDPLVSVESQREFDLFTGEWAHRVFVKLYVAARTSGLLSAISDRDWKTLCTLATYMDGEGYCFPSQAELAAAMGCSRQMANERVRSLASFRFQDQPVLVIVKGKRGAAGKWAGNGYRVLSLSSLRIYDAQEGPGTALIPGNDSDVDSRPEANGTVSRKLDTVQASEATVSSQTGTVALDTNKNHSSEQDLSFEFRKASRENISSFERSHDQIDGIERDPALWQHPERHPSQTTKLAAGEVLVTPSSETPVNGVASLKTLLQRRRQETGAGPRRGRPVGTSDDREQLRAFLADFAVELGDEAPLASTITRTLNIFTAAGVASERWSDYLYQARGLTQEHTAQIRKLATGESPVRRKNKMPYFFATLEQLVGLRPEPTHPPASRREGV